MENRGKRIYITDEDRLKEIKDYIDANLNDDLSLERLAGHYAISRRTLQRQFMYVYKQSVSAYIHHQRMQTAMKYATSSTMRINQIANALGYKSFPSFIKAFTKYHGHPPSFYLDPVNE